jgi:hypothetical protein
MSKNWWEKSSNTKLVLSHPHISTNTKSLPPPHPDSHRWKKIWAYFKKNWIVILIVFFTILSLIIFGIGFAIKQKNVKYPFLGDNVPNNNYITNLSFGTSFDTSTSSTKLYCKEGDTAIPITTSGSSDSFTNHSLNDNFKTCVNNPNPMPYNQLCYNSPSEINDGDFVITDIKMENWATPSPSPTPSPAPTWKPLKNRCQSDNNETWLPISTDSITDILSPDIRGEICTPSTHPYQKLCKGDKCCGLLYKNGICMKLDNYSTVKSGKVKGLKSSDLMINVTDKGSSNPCPSGYTLVGNIHKGCPGRSQDVNICKK